MIQCIKPAWPLGALLGLAAVLFASAGPAGAQPRPGPSEVGITAPEEGAVLTTPSPQLAVEVRFARDRVPVRVTAEVVGETTITRFDVCGGEAAIACERALRDLTLRFEAPAFFGGNQIELTAVDASGAEFSFRRGITVRKDLFLKYDLLVLTPEAFAAEVQPLISHKAATGMPARMLTLESIDQDPSFASGRDLQEKIKLAIAQAHAKSGVQYVLLMGDVDRFPVRYSRTWDAVHWGHGFAPSDLYYADLYNAQGGFDDWDADHDGYFGEMNTGNPSGWNDLNQDGVDLRPDVAVGRIPASTSAEVATMVAKIIAYELNAGPSWNHRLMLVTGNFANPNPVADAIASQLAPLGYAAIKHYWTTDWTTIPDTDPQWFSKRVALLSGEFDAGVAFAAYLGHGWGGQAGSIGGNGGGWAGWYDYTSVASLQNQSRLPVVLAAACDTAMFHYPHWPYATKAGGVYTPLAGVPNPQQNAPEPAAIQPAQYDLDTMAEHFLVKSKAGAIGYLGGYTGLQPASFQVVRRFFEELAALGGAATLGDVWAGGVKRYIASDFPAIPNSWGNWYAAAIFHHIQKMPLFGDPSLRLGGLGGFYSICDLHPWICEKLLVCKGPGCRVKYIYRGDPIRWVDPRDRFVLPVEKINQVFKRAERLDRLPAEVEIEIETRTAGLMAAVYDDRDEAAVVEPTVVDGATRLRFGAREGRQYLLVLSPAPEARLGEEVSLAIVARPAGR